MKEEEYRPRQPIMLNAGRGKGMKTKKLWVIKKLKLDGIIEVEEPYSRKMKVIKKHRPSGTIIALDKNYRQAI